MTLYGKTVSKFRQDVWEGRRSHTPGHLTKDDLVPVMSKDGTKIIRLKSKRKVSIGKKMSIKDVNATDRIQQAIQEVCSSPTQQDGKEDSTKERRNSTTSS